MFFTRFEVSTVVKIQVEVFRVKTEAAWTSYHNTTRHHSTEDLNLYIFICYHLRTWQRCETLRLYNI